MRPKCLGLGASSLIGATLLSFTGVEQCDRPKNRHWRSRLIECCQGDGVLLGSVSAIRAFSLQRWIRLPAARARCVCHFLGIAATLAAAKVLLSTIGVAQFVSEQGAAGLPPFYVGFAAIAILLSFGLGSIIDRVPKVRLAQLTFAALLGGTAALCIPLALGVPGIGFALLASATAFEIILDIVFWVVVAAYLDAFEFRRGTPLIYMALALGGAAGGTIARVGAGTLSPPDFLLLLLPLAVLLMVQLDVVARRLREVPDNHSDLDGAEEGSGPLLLGRLLKRYPLALLIALNALVVTLLYGLSEFLVLSIYETRFASDVELTEFLSLLFAFMQIIEFGLLYTLTRVLLERAGPLLRNLAFPMTSLGSLLLLTISPRLPAAVAMHVNIEAVSNAIFLPIGNANYIPLPLSCQGRARTLSEGIFYPIGLALAGVVLWAVDSDAALRQVEYVSLVFAGLFVLLGVGIGVLFLPTLRANVGAGLITPGQAVGSELLSAPRIRTLLHSREVELCLLGVALARRHGPATLEDDLLALATRPDRVTRTALARLVADAPRPWGQSFLGRTLARGGTEEVKLALLVLLIRRAPLQPEHQPRILGAHDPTVLVLGYVVAQGLRAWDQIQPLIGDAEIASDLVDAIVSAERADLALLLFACLASAAPEQQCRALVMLNSAAGPVSGATTDILRRLASRPDPFVRAEAIVLLSRTLAPARAVAELLAALDDPSRHVRHRVAEALCAYGDQTTAALRGRLRTVCASTPDAVRALAQIATPEARRLLAGFVRALQQDAERTAGLLASIAARHDRARWSTLELCLCEHQARIVDVVMAALSSAIESPAGAPDQGRAAKRRPAKPGLRLRADCRHAWVPTCPGCGGAAALRPVRERR